MEKSSFLWFQYSSILLGHLFLIHLCLIAGNLFLNMWNWLNEIFYGFHHDIKWFSSLRAQRCNAMKWLFRSCWCEHDIYVLLMSLIFLYSFYFTQKPVSHTVKSNVLIGQILLMISEAGQTDCTLSRMKPFRLRILNWDIFPAPIRMMEREVCPNSNLSQKPHNIKRYNPFPQSTCEYTEKKNWHSYKSDLLHWSSTEPALLNDTTSHQQDLRKNPVIKSHCHCSPPINFTDVDLIVWDDLGMNLRFLK